MKETFHEFFRPSEDEFSALWQTGLISFDANTLLNLYRYSPDSSDALVGLIKTYTDRIRLPHQFSSEYAKNRPKVIIKQVKNYSDAEDAFAAIERDHIQSNREHPHLSEDAESHIKEIKEELSEKRKMIEKLISADRYADFLLSACAGKISPAPDTEKLNELYAKAKDRYEKMIPPGFHDQEKGLPDAYGDYIAWEQLISISSDEKKGMILVTDDLKEDWWWKESGRTIGPRPELLSEFWSRSGCRVWLYTSVGFLRAAKQYANAEVSDELLKEAIEQQEGARRQQEARKSKPAQLIEFGNTEKLAISAAALKPKSQPETAKPNIWSESAKPDDEIGEA